MARQSIQEVFTVRMKTDDKWNAVTSTVGDLHGSDANRWTLFCPINHSVVIYKPFLVNKYYLFDDILL